MKNIKRPLAAVIICLITGILGGQMYLKQIHLFPIFLIGLLIATIICTIIYDIQMVLVGIGAVLLGILYLLGHPILIEQQYFTQGHKVVVEGQINSISEGTFSNMLTLKQVTIIQQDKAYFIKSKINVKISKPQQLMPYERIRLTGEVLPKAQKMNPSDMDYENYLMSQGIIAVVKADYYEKIREDSVYSTRVTSIFEQQIDKLFQQKDYGIIKTLLIGKDNSIPDQVRQTYSKTGIGHVLAISGFHIALLMSCTYILLSCLGITYVPRYSIILCVIWCYAILTGASISTVRACIMASLMMLARCFWEEEDAVTHLALAAAVILIYNPFQAAQAGFQLSFMAVASLMLSKKLLEQLELTLSEKYYKLACFISPWLCITLATSPILAFHFYEVPFLCSLLNLVLIPMFSLIIILAWFSVMISFITFNSGFFIAKVILILLNSIRFIAESMLKIPLGTLCIGRPSLLWIILYYAFMLLISCYLLGGLKKGLCFRLSALLVTFILLYMFFVPRLLSITYLYVGQGDGSVIMTPKRQVVVIDAGQFGKGRVIENYLKYKGKKTISAFILSHSDADHAGGLLDLLNTDIHIENLFISRCDQSLLLEQILQKCRDKKIAVYQMGIADTFTMGELRITCLMPNSLIKDLDNNNNSLGCLVQYKAFSGLFTGDMDKAHEQKMCAYLEPITVLKVSHHGSKTSTAKEALLKIQPKYAIISCGIDNRYQHPHQDTLDILKEYDIDTLRTDKHGAIMLKTDGSALKITTQLKGAP